MSNLEYGQWDKEQFDKDKDLFDEEGGGGFLKLKEGKTRLRLVPPRKGVKQPIVRVYQHYVEIDGEGKGFNCPLKMAKQACPVCEKLPKMSPERAKDLRPKARYFCNVLPRKSTEPQVKIVAFGRMIMDGIFEILDDPDTNVLHPILGHDIVITRKGTNKQTKYSVRVVQSPSPMLYDAEGEPMMDEMQAIIDGQEDLTDRTKVLKYATIVKILRGEAMPSFPALASGDGGGGSSTRAIDVENDGYATEDDQDSPDDDDVTF